MLKYFDCNCSFGCSGKPPLRFAADAAELIAEMDFCGIDRGLVYHAGMRFGSPLFWNERILAEIKNRNRLVPCWTLLPPQTGETPRPEFLAGNMREAGVKILRVFPDEHRYALDSLTFGGIFEMMTAGRIPLFAKLNLTSLSGVLKDFPGLRVVAVNQGPHSLERFSRPLLEKHPNFYLETSCYLVDRLIEEFCRIFGPERLLFGSGFPDNCSGAALLRLARADIDAAAKALVAGGNLDRLLKEVQL